MGHGCARIRIHVSQCGGFRPARKIAALAEPFGVRTAWHGPGDVLPASRAANITLDLTCYNFGIQEWTGFRRQSQEIFAGCPALKDGYAWVIEKTGWASKLMRDSRQSSHSALITEIENDAMGGWDELRPNDRTIIKQ